MGEEESNEQPVEGGGGENLSGSGYQFRGVDARERLWDSGDVLVNVTGGEENLNNTELMSLMSLDGGMGEDGDAEMEELGRMACSNVYNGDVKMVDLWQLPAPLVDKVTTMDELCLFMSWLRLVDDDDTEMTDLDPEMGELCIYISQLTIEDPSYERTVFWCLQLAKVEAYEDIDDESSIGDATELELITPVQPSLDQECRVHYEYMDPLSEAVYVHDHTLEYSHSQLEDAPGDGTKRMDYPSLFRGDFHC
ncbi:hypothetical protein RSAG8_06454, partial [Rhizoctonia solani AG-8 WAC10335]